MSNDLAAPDATLTSSFDFSLLFNTPRAMFSVAGPDGFFREVNPAFEQLLGYSREQLLERSLFEFVLPADIPKTLKALSELETERGDFVLENRWLHASGSVHWLAWIAKIDPVTGLWYATARDVTESRQAQDKLRELQQRLTLALSVAQAGSWDWNISEDCLSLDEGTEILLGLLPGQFRGGVHRLMQLIHPQDRTRIFELIRSVESRADGIEADFRLRDESKGTRYIAIRGRIVAWDRRSRPQRGVGIVFDSTNQKALEEQLLTLVMNDPLTGVRNRRSFDQAFRREWRSASRAKRPLSMLMIDVDEFKRYNDHYGHQAGDDALCSVAKALGDSLKRASDLLARYGGEEFVVLLPDTPLEDAQRLATRLVDVTAALAVPHTESLHQRITISIGAASLTPEDPHRPADLITAADQALYRAKKLGRNRVAI